MMGLSFFFNLKTKERVIPKLTLAQCNCTDKQLLQKLKKLVLKRIQSQETSPLVTKGNAFIIYLDPVHTTNHPDELVQADI